MASFQNFFLSFLGRQFLMLMYREILREPGNVSLVAVSSDDDVIGFVVGVKDQVGFYQRLVKGKSLAFASASLRAVMRRPSIVPRLFRALRAAGKAMEATSPASLMSIAMSPAAKGKGTGKSLVKCFLDQMAQNGVEMICLTTDRDNNENTNMFYLKFGFARTREFQTPEGRWMYEYSIRTNVITAETCLRSEYVFSRTDDIDEELGIENLAEWYRRQGLSVIRTKSSYWCGLGPRVYQSFPFYNIIQPGESELKTLLVHRRAIALRYSTDMSSVRGIVSYHAICDDHEYDISKLSRQSRQNVAKGLEHCVVKRIPFERLGLEGWRLHNDTLERQERRDHLSNGAWEKKCRAAVGLPGFEAWGAILDGELAALITLVQIGEWVVFLFQYSRTKHLHAKPNHALIYSLTKNIMNRHNVKSIFYTLQSLDAPASIDNFKFRMGYRPILVKQRVVFHPHVSPLVNKHTLRIMQWGQRSYPASSRLAKTEGMIRFSVDGQKRLLMQNIPEIVKNSYREYVQRQKELQ